MVNESEFLVLRSLAEKKDFNPMEISMDTGLSEYDIFAVIKTLGDRGLVNGTVVTAGGFCELTPYRVDNAIILAAGMATRFIPVSYEIPKGLVEVCGEVLIERQIRQLQEVGIDEIIVVVGHMLEKFIYLRDKYGVKLVVNNDYKSKNTHSSMFVSRDYMRNTYVCCSDNFYPQNMFHAYEYYALYCAQYLNGSSRTERGLITDATGLIVDSEKPTENKWIMAGYAYYDRAFSYAFKPLLEAYYGKPGTDHMYWEMIYAEHLDTLRMYIRKCKPEQIFEFDNVDELAAFDHSFLAHNDLEIIKNICSVLNVEPDDIHEIVSINGGMTNMSFRFSVQDTRYVYRNPGKNTFGYINREREKFALQVAKDLGIDRTFIFEDEKMGWKLSHYVNITEDFDFGKKEHLSKLCAHLHKLHDSGIKCNIEFDFFLEADKLIERMKIINILAARDLLELREKIRSVNEARIEDGWPVQLSHNDIYAPNLLISGDTLNLIDWEYAGDTDIGFDISMLISAANFDDNAISDYLSVYYGRMPTVEERRHVLACAVVKYYYWYVWAVYQNHSGCEYSEWQMQWFNKMNNYAAEMTALKERN